MARDVDKGPDAFRTISEVADDLDLPQHVLRFWEGRFPQIKPLKRGGGRRYYRPDDVDLLKGIRHLLYGEGYTIRGVQRILKEQGVRFVMTVWQEGAPPPPPGRASDFADDAGDFHHGGHHESRHAALDDDAFGFDDGFAAEPATAPAGPAYGDEPGAEAGPSVASIAQRFAPRLGEPPRAAPRALQAERHSDDEPTVAVARPALPRSERHGGERLPAGVAPDDDLPADEGRSALGAFIDRLRPSGHTGHGGRAEAEPATPPRLSRDDVRHLQATLFELLECKRLLDQAR